MVVDEVRDGRIKEGGKKGKRGGASPMNWKGNVRKWKGGGHGSLALSK